MMKYLYSFLVIINAIVLYPLIPREGAQQRSLTGTISSFFSGRCEKAPCLWASVQRHYRDGTKRDSAHKLYVCFMLSSVHKWDFNGA